MQSIFLVEDDENISEIIGYALKNSGYNVKRFESGEQLWDELEINAPDLFILDIMLLDESGVEILKRIKLNSLLNEIPIMMLTARGSDQDKIQCFDLGVDDYITKPFSVLELIARVKAVIKRSQIKSSKVLKHENIEIDVNSRVVKYSNNNVELTYKEFELLKYLFENQGIVITREQLIENIWGDEFYGSYRTVDMHIKSLRKKVDENKTLIKSVRGVGYKI